MKTFALIVALLSIGLVSRAAGPLAIKNGVLQSDMNGGGYKLTNIVDVLDTNGISLLGGTGGTNGGSGNVVGPPSSTDATFALFRGTSGTGLTNRDATGTYGPSTFALATAPVAAATAATNGYPWGALYDPAGSTNGFTATNDSRALNLSATANKIRGNMYGYFWETNTDAGAGFSGLKIGKNDINSFVTSGSPGTENLTQRLPPNGFIIEPDDNSGVLSWFGKNHSGVDPDMSLRFTGRATSVVGVGASTMEGAPITIEAPYVGGSASSMSDLPTRGPEIWKAKQHPWIGFFSDVVGQDTGSATGWKLFQKVFTNAPTVAHWFNTSGVVKALSPYGVQVGFWGDTGAFTNRAAGSLQFDPAILTAAGITTVSNYSLALHTNGVKWSLANYRTTFPINVWAGDTGRVQTNGISGDVGYPSQVTTPGPIWGAISPETIERDEMWYYTNYVDELFVQDAVPVTGIAGYEQQIAKFAYGSLYLNSPLADHIFWKDFLYTGVVDPQILPGAGAFTNQLILGWFANHPSSQTPYMLNDYTPDHAFPQIGSEPGLAQGLSLLRAFDDEMSEWTDAPVFPLFALSNSGNNGTETKTTLTNFLAAGEMAHGNIYFGVDTNNWSWNTNLSGIVTNASLYLSTWQDNTLKKPIRIFDDGTNSAWVRPIDNNCFLILAANQSASSSNYSIHVTGLPTNVVYNATNVISQDGFGSGYLTNNFIGTVASGTVVYVRLTPVGDGSGFINLNASQLLSGTVPMARLSSNVTTNRGTLSATVVRGDGGGGVTNATPEVDYLPARLLSTWTGPTNSLDLTNDLYFSALTNCAITNVINLSSTVLRCGSVTIFNTNAAGSITITTSIPGAALLGSNTVASVSLAGGKRFQVIVQAQQGVMTNQVTGAMQ